MILVQQLLWVLIWPIYTSFAQCSDPSIRREWRAISESERADWIAGVKCLAKLPHDDSLKVTQDPYITQIPPVNISSSYYDDFSYIHMDLNHVIHQTGFFLPWHRHYVNALETAMKQKCGYNGSHPYWDWTMDTSDFYNSNMFDPSTAISGFGGWGDPKNDFQVADGAFSTDFVVSYPSPHLIRRNFTKQPWIGQFSVFDDGSILPYNTSQLATDLFTKASQEQIVNGNVGDFIGFQSQLSAPTGSSHAAVHRIVGGDLFGGCPANAPSCVPGQKWSPNDPLFFMHHAMIDKLWYDWQHKHPVNLWSFLGGAEQVLKSAALYLSFPTGAPPFLNLNSPIPTDGILPDATIYDVMDTTGGILCYVYE